MGIIAKLRHGTDEFDINSGRYCVATNHTPPTTQYGIAYSRAPLGAQAVAKTAENVTWAFGLHITAASVSEARQAVQNLANFLRRAGTGPKPVELLYREYDDYTFEPYFGQTAAYTRYHVEHGEIHAGADWHLVQTSAGTAPNAQLLLTIRPNGYGKFQRAAQATGAVFEDYLGKSDGTVRGTIVPESTTNRFTNPIFGHGTWNTGWTATGTGGVASESRNTPASSGDDVVLFGTTSAKLTISGTATRFTQSLNVGNTNTHVISFYVKANDGGEIASDDTDVQVYYGSAQSTGVISVGDGWYRCWKNVTGVASATEAGVLVNDSTRIYYVDGFQMEEKAYPTPLAHGDLEDCTWDGTNHNSRTTRTAAAVKYAYDDIMPARQSYTIRLAWKPEVSTFANHGSSRYFFEDSSDDLSLLVTTSNTLTYAIDSGVSITSAAVSFTAGTAEIYHLTYDGNAMKIYRNGSELQTGSAKTAPNSEPTSVFIGSDNASANQVNGTIMGFAVFDRAMTAAEVTADHREVTQQITDDDRIDPLPYIWTEDGDGILDNEHDETNDFPYAMVSGLLGDSLDIEYYITVSSSFQNYGGYTIGSLPVVPKMYNKDVHNFSDTSARMLFYDASGTTDATANNDAHQSISVSTAKTDVASIVFGQRAWFYTQDVDNFYAVAVLSDSGSNLQLQLQMQTGVNEGLSTPWRSVNADTSYRPFLLGPVSAPTELTILDSTRGQGGLQLWGRRTTGTASIKLSHVIAFPNLSTVYLGDTSNINALYVGQRVEQVNTGADDTETRGIRYLSGPLVLWPHRQNVLIYLQSSDNYAASKTSFDPDVTLSFGKMSIRPRWEVM